MAPRIKAKSATEDKITHGPVTSRMPPTAQEITKSRPNQRAEGKLRRFETYHGYTPKWLKLPWDHRSTSGLIFDNLTYTEKDGGAFDSIKKTRRYYLGAVAVGYATICHEDRAPAPWLCSISSQDAAQSFKTEKEMHAFILGELTADANTR